MYTLKASLHHFFSPAVNCLTCNVTRLLSPINTPPLARVYIIYHIIDTYLLSDHLSFFFVLKGAAYPLPATGSQ